MAEDYTGVGEFAALNGLPTVDPTTHKVKYGGDEINVTRDLLAQRSQFGPTVPAAGAGELGWIFFKTPS